MGEIVIRVNGRIIERFIYILIIIILSVLLVTSYLGDSCSDDVKSANNDENVDSVDDSAVDAVDSVVVEPVIEDTEPEIIVPTVETCDDGVKNQDETYIDCGGSCTSINGKYWYDNDCHKTEQLTGKLDFNVISVITEQSPSTPAIKVTKIKVSVVNGKEDKLVDAKLELYAKSSSDVLLNQYKEGETPYAVIDLPTVDSGKSISQTLDVTSSYLFDQVSYDMGDDFKLEVKLVDSDGDTLDKVTKSVKP